MRVSIRDNDRGYDRAAQAGWWKQHLGKCKVLIDGLDITDKCSTADEEEGVAFCYILDKNNRKYFDFDLGFIAAQALYGKVEIQIPGRLG